MQQIIPLLLEAGVMQLAEKAVRKLPESPSKNYLVRVVAYVERADP